MCIYKGKNGTCKRHSSGGALWQCVGLKCPDYVASKGEMFHNMADVEMADFISRNCLKTLCEIVCGDECKAHTEDASEPRVACRKIVLAWLRNSAEEQSSNPQMDEYTAEWCEYVFGERRSE